jgi:NAD(P)-dependent dehydrogenase (short-subunit alcohol dehydrogenase family)
MGAYRPGTAIITGGASGIGRALAACLVAGGTYAVLADRDYPAAERAAADLSAGGPGRAVAAELDVTDAAAVHALVDSVAAQRGRLDLMANNAGVLFAGAFEETTDRHWDVAIAVNLRGVVEGARAAYDIMAAQRRGRERAGVILNTASLAGLIPGPTMAPYTTTKWAVVGFSQALRAEVRRHGIQVNVLCPGYVDTKLIDEVFEPGPTYAVGRFRANIKALQPRLLTADEVAAAAVRGIERDRPVIPVGGFAQLSWRAQRFAPGVVRQSTRLQAAREARQARRVAHGDADVTG